MLQVTLFESDFGDDGVPLIKLQIAREPGNENSPVATNILEWNYDHISRVLKDHDIHLLGLAT